MIIHYEIFKKFPIPNKNGFFFNIKVFINILKYYEKNY